MIKWKNLNTHFDKLLNPGIFYFNSFLSVAFKDGCFVVLFVLTNIRGILFNYLNPNRSEPGLLDRRMQL